MKLKVGDTVMIIAGKDKGKLGKIKQLIKTTNKVIVEGINVNIKHKKPTTTDESGSLIQKESPIHLSNTMLCDSNNVPGRIYTIKNGKNRERISKKSGEKIT